ncbi:MAG: hypothetical protein ACK421_10115 [Pseudanabaenaceae cyanobacterium]
MKPLCPALLLVLVLVLTLPLPAAAVQSPRRGVECRVFSKLYNNWHSQAAPKIDHPTIAQAFTEQLGSDVSALNLQDPTLQTIQQQLVSGLQAMAEVFKNIREGQLVGDPYVLERNLPYLQSLTASLNLNTKQLNDYCKGVWGYRALPVE